MAANRVAQVTTLTPENFMSEYRFLSASKASTFTSMLGRANIPHRAHIERHRRKPPVYVVMVQKQRVH